MFAFFLLYVIENRDLKIDNYKENRIFVIESQKTDIFIYNLVWKTILENLRPNI